MSQVIALVDDDRNILTSVSIALQQEGFVTRVYSDGDGGAEGACRQSARPWRVRHQDAAAWTAWSCFAGCARPARMPVIFLTSKDDELDEALGLAMGADDYIAKPFSQRLLIARIRAILRRQELARGEAHAATPASREAAADRARPAGHGPGAAQGLAGTASDVSLTVTEFLILEALAQRPGVVKNRNQLLDVAYNDDVYVDDRTIDSHIKRIRRKFRAVDPDFDAIETLYGVGYRFRRMTTRPTSR